MKMGFRWYGEGNDTITLDEIRQIPGVETIVWSLHHKQAGQVWEIGCECRQVHPKSPIRLQIKSSCSDPRITPIFTNTSKN